MSASMIKTGPCRWAKDMARLVAVEVFPSPICALVTSRVWGGRGAVESKTEVRRLRNDSAMGEEGRFRTAKPTPFGPAALKARPRGHLLSPVPVGFGRDNRQGRSVDEPFRFFRGAHRAVQSFLHEGQGDPKNQTDHQARRQIAPPVRADRARRGWSAGSIT